MIRNRLHWLALLLAAVAPLCLHAQGMVELKTAATVEDLHYPPNVKYIQIPQSNARIAFTDEGRGPHTLVFIHGLGSYLPAWRKNFDVLSKQFRCIAVDLPGYGKSSKNRYEANLIFQATAVKQLLDMLGIKKAVLVGHSMGAQIALHLALMSPALIEKLVLVAPAGFETFTPAEAVLLKNTLSQERIAATTDSMIRLNLAQNFYQMPDAAKFMADDRILMRRLPGFGYYCYVVAQGVKGMLDQPVYDKLPAVKQPVLVLYGLSDKLIPNPYLHPGLTTDSVARLGCTRLPNCRYYLLPGAGHMAMFEQPELTNKYIVEFLLGKPQEKKK
jgi:pimeloyl-ACP methyl ester carboxylesterase